jgi:hypothetical protein
MCIDKRELYKTATIARSGSIFVFGEIVRIRVKYRTPQCYIYECRLGDRVANYAEGFLKDFCL